ncbi:MAG: S-ribosylhomocysteine lyase [Oscillospiraceae bacterium]|jgi:S-ribosylhomocysteine lyase|nr:S-ribosylhomocysteine lyase [Oscillospiraceae bacterium]
MEFKAKTPNVGVASFAKDHFKIEPHSVTIQVQTIIETSGGEIPVYKADIRFYRPNSGEYFYLLGCHSAEHLLSTAAYAIYGAKILDLSPMGCMTGFYCTFLAPELLEYSAWVRIFEDALAIETLPGALPETCGNYLMHDTISAKKALREFLNGYSEELFRVK